MPDLTADPVFTPSFQQALDKEIRSRANMNLQMAGQLSLGPDEMAKGIKTAAHYGMSLEDYMQLGDLRKSLPDSLDNYGTGYPGVARWLADKPLNAAVAKDDLPALTSIEAMLRRPELRPLWLGAHGPDASWGELLAAQWSMGWNATTSGGLSDKYVGKYFFGQDNDAEIAALQEQQGLDAAVIERSSGGFWNWLTGNAAQAIPSTFQVLKEGGKGAGIGALATAWTGPGAAFGGKLGFQAGAFQAAFRMEAGAALQQMEGMRDEAGNPPSREMMVSVASAVGLANASLELVGFGVMKRMFTSAEAKKVALTLALEAGLAKLGFKGAAKEAMAKVVSKTAEAMAKEGTTEGTQQGITDLGGKLVAIAEDMTKNVQSLPDIGWDVIQNAAAGTALPLTLGPISLAYHVATVKSQAEQTKDFVRQQDAISAAAQDSATTARGHGAGVLRTMFEEAKQPVNFWMTARDAQDLAQSGFSATLTKAGVNLDTLASQVETGAVLPVDRAVLLTDKDAWAAARDRVLPTPDGASLRESSTTLTPAEAKQMEELLASSQEGKYLAERTRIFKEMTTAGVPKDQALAVMQHLDRQSAIMDMHADRGLAYLQSIRFAKEAPAAGPKAEVAAPAGGVTEFRTEKGSTYQVDPQGRTTRNKALHANDTRAVGIQPISDRTIYVDKSAAGAFGMHQSLSGTKGVVIQGDRVFPVSKNNPQGKWGVAPSEKEGYAFSEIPEVGSAPLELWEQGDDGAWSNWHPGNAIVAIDRRSAAEPTRSAEAPAAAQTPPGYSAEAKTLLQRFKQFPVTMQQVRNSNEETTPIDMLPPELQGMKARMPIQYLAKKVHVGEANKMAQAETRPYPKKTLHQPAYHGTGNPEVYNRFSVKYVNGRGGEGTQTQGFGLYFTGREAVADWYRNKNSRNQEHLWVYDGKEFEPRSAVGIALDLLYELADTKDGVRVWDKESTVWWAKNNGLDAPGGKITWRGVDTDELEKIIEGLDQSKVSEASAQRGRLYTVDIPSDEELLNWDKPLREQTPAIQQKVVHAINDIAELTYGRKTTLASIQKFTGKELYHSMTQTILRHGYNVAWDIPVPRIEAESIVSLAFADRGIPGTVYLSNTASQLPKDQQYNNYVIFNDSAITILSYRQEERGRIDIIRAQGQTPAQHLITLIEGRSNADTIFHELAHHFAQEVQDAVEGTPDSKPTASATLAKQWDTVKKALGVVGNTWTEDQEEKFADWTVAYMYTATAPPGLKGFFTRVRKWFSKVQDQLPVGIVLPDDVKAVFDTWNQAETATLSTAVWNALPFVDKIEGLTKKQSDRLRELYQTGRDQMVANLKKRQDQAASTARAKVAKDAEKILAREPVYRAYKLIREAGGLSRDNPELGAILGEGINPLFTELDSKSLLGGTGDATAIAKTAGFDDVASMLAELQTRSTPEGYLEYWKGEAETAARNKVPSFTALCNTGEIAAYLYRVAEYLVSASNTKINNASQAAMEAYARQELDKLPLGQGSNANRFMGTFHRAMMAERRALLAGKIDVAATEAQRARLALEMARQAALRKKDILKTQKLAKKINRLAKGKMGGDHQDAARILAIRTGLVRASETWTPHPKRKTIKDLTNPAARGTEDVAIASPEWSPWLLNEAEDAPWTKMTAGEFRELSNLLSFLYTRGRQVIGALSDGTMAKAKRDECLATMKDVKSSKQLENANLMHKLPLLKQIWVNIPLFMMRYITGEADNFVSLEGKEGPNDRYIYKPLAKAESKGDAIESRVTKRLQKYGRWLQTFGDRMGRVIKTDVPVSAAMKRAGDHAWTVEHIVGLAQNRGTEANWRIALAGHDLTEDQGDALMNLLTAEDMAAVQSMWDAIGTLKTPMAEVFLRVNGYRMTEVVAQPFMHQGKRFAGGYFPLRYMTKKLGASLNATAKESEALLAERHNALFPRTENRQTMERTDAGGRSVLLHPHVLSDHIHDAARYIACTEAIQDAWSLVMNEEYMAEISRVMGVSYDRMQAWFVDRFHHMARPKDEAAKSSTLVRWMKGAASPFVLAYNLGSAASEITSLPVTADRIGFVPSLQAGWLMLFHPVESFRLANQLSPFVKRITTYFRDDSAQQLNELSIQNKYKRGWRMVQKIGMFPKMGMNHLMGIHAWWAAFYRALQTTDMRGKDFMEVARQAANQAMVDGKVEEAIYQADRGAAGAQSEKNPLEETDITKMQGTASLFMMMMTYWTQQFAGRRYSKRATEKGQRSYRRHAWSWFLQVPTVALMSTVINSFLWSRTPEDEPPEEFAKRWIGDVGMTQLAGVPFVRDALQASLVVMRDRGSSATRSPGLGLIASSLTMEFFSRLGRAADRHDQKTVNALLWSGANLISLASGVPVSKVYYRLTESWRQYQEEEAGLQTVLLMTPDPDLASKERARTR